MEKAIIKDLVSIIIPTHNRPDYIAKTLTSVLDQKYKKIEVILVDDHSETEYIQYLNKCITSLKSSEKIFLIPNEGIGGNAARNTGIRHSRGQYIQFFDDDDLMQPEHIEKKVVAIQKESVDYVACNYTFFNTDEPEIIIDKKDISSISHVAAVHVLSKSLPTPCFMCTRDTINKIGFWNERIKKLQDFSYFHRLFLYDCKGYYMNDSLFKVRVHRKSLTQSNINATEGQLYTLEAINSVKEEWKNAGGEKWKSVKLPVVFMQFTTGRNLFLKGYKMLGTKLLLQLAFENPKEICQLLYKSAKNKTIHLTEILIEEYGGKG